MYGTIISLIIDWMLRFWKRFFNDHACSDIFEHEIDFITFFE